MEQVGSELPLAVLPFIGHDNELLDNKMKETRVVELLKPSHHLKGRKQGVRRFVIA